MPLAASYQQLVIAGLDPAIHCIEISDWWAGGVDDRLKSTPGGTTSGEEAMIKVVEQGKPITSEEIKQTEIGLGILIPEPYRTFLLNNNGGRPEPDGIDINGLPGEETSVQSFVAVKDDDESNTIEFNLDILREGYPHKNVLPIALDSSGGIFCLDLGEEIGFPVIYFEWGGAWKSEPYEPLHVAADFKAFLNMMHQ